MTPDPSPPDPPGGWPRFEAEELPWARTRQPFASRRQLQSVADTYEAAVPPVIGEINEIPIGGRLAAEVAEAEATIARYDATVAPHLDGFAVVALRTEAAASSQIEQLSASPRSIALAELTASSSVNARLVVDNVAALRAAIDHPGPTVPDTIVELQRALLGRTAPGLVGAFRGEQVWIGGTSLSPHQARYVAPHHERVPGAVADLCRFMSRTELGGLAHIAVAHAHFEAIHPFPDGNGRTGRALVQRMLRTHVLSERSLLPISAGLLVETDRYFDALDTYRSGDVEPIVRCFVDATFSAASNAATLAEDLQAVRDRWLERLHARRGAAVWRAVDHCIAQPAVSVASLSHGLSVSIATAERAIDALAEAGVLLQNSDARRNRVWIVAEVVECLDAFVDRAGRRR